MEERFTAASRPGPRLVGGRGEGSKALQDTPSLFSGHPSSPTGLRPDELEGLGEKAGICLLTSLSTSQPSLNCCLNPLTNCPFLTVGCLWAAPTAALAGPLMGGSLTVGCQWAGPTKVPTDD